MTGFRTSLTDVALCSRALSMLKEEPIADMEQAGNAARTARIWYKPTVAWLLERHHWNLAVRRTALAAVANTRNVEWLYAYQRPIDLAFIVGIGQGDSSTGYYAAVRGALGGNRYSVVGDTIFSRTPAAYVDYTSYDVSEALFDETFANVIVLHLAARFAMPITNKATLAREYQSIAADALALAMTQNANEDMPTYGNTPTESELVRGAIGGVGYYDEMFMGGGVAGNPLGSNTGL